MRSLQKWSPSKTFKISEGGPSENSKKGGPSEMLKKVGQCRKQKATSCKLKNRVRASPLMANRVTQILRQKLKWKQELTFRSNLEIREGFKKDSRFDLLLKQGGRIHKDLKEHRNGFFQFLYVRKQAEL